jgi:hypothetical protein
MIITTKGGEPYYWIVGEVVFDLVIPVIVDLIFAGIYLEFLVRLRSTTEILYRNPR